MARTANNGALHWGSAPKRGGSKVMLGALTAVSVGVGILSLTAGMTIGWLPVLGAAAQTPLMIGSHIIDRLKNGVVKKDELEYRAKFYTKQIYQTLGNKNIPEGRSATVQEFKLAASINPAIGKLYRAPLQVENKANNESLLVNGGIAAAGLVPMGSAVAGVAEVGKTALEVGHAAKIISGTVSAAKALLPPVAAGLAGGAIANAISGKEVDPQALVEAIQKTVEDARAKGIKPSTVVTPNMIFLLRASQDKNLSAAIKRDIGGGKKGFQEMNEEEQARVMAAYPALANAVTSEAYAVANDILPAEELGATQPNLDSTANAYAVGNANSSFAARIQAQRAAGANVSFAAREQAREAANANNPAMNSQAM